MNVVANAAHPGAVKTSLGKNFFEKGTTGKKFCTLPVKGYAYGFRSTSNRTPDLSTLET